MPKSSLLFLACGIVLGSVAAQAKPTHPLDPLEAGEYAVLKKALDGSKKFSSRVMYPWAQLNEPPKREVLDWQVGQPFRREAYVVAIDPAKRSSFECVVNVRTGGIKSIKNLKNLQPFLSETEFDVANNAINKELKIKKALQRRGYKVNGKISDAVYLDPYAPGEDEWLKAHPGTRAIRVLFADKTGTTNVYGPYIEGLMALVDVHARKVVKIVDEPSVASPSIKSAHDIFSPQVRGTKRAGLKPLEITQPKGVSYTLKGNHIQWQGWDFRYSFNLREGLVLHQVGFRDKGKLRPIMYRGAVSEMLVPYVDTSENWLWREFFDEGEYGLGFSSTNVRAGKELPANAQTIAGLLPYEDLTFEADGYPDRVYIYERDGGPFVFHKQWTDGTRVYARGRELVIGFVATLGNYDYFYNWVFKQDGSFQFACDLEGLILNKTVPGQMCAVCAKQAQGGPGQTYTGKGDEKFGTMVDKHVLGVNHQHWINLRLDFDIDGPVNAVKECNTQRIPQGKDNPLGRAYTVSHSIFADEKSAQRNMNMESNRSWIFYNPAQKSSLGHPTGYVIEPAGNTTTMMPESRKMSEVGFTARHFWATVNKPNEMYAAGKFPNQASKGYTDALPFYSGNESVYKKDLVGWFNLGYTHVTKPEDFPIMPAGHIAVDFKPKGFFTKSPALDLLTVEKGEE